MKKYIQQLNTLIDNHPKHFTKMIKHDDALYNHVMTFHGDTLPEKIYNVIHDNNNDTCQFGNKFKFRGVNHGYGFCGRAAKCQCASESVTTKLLKRWENTTDQEKEIRTQKTIATVKEKYGVNNVGQTLEAIKRHQEFYADSEKVENAVKKGKATKLERHGDENYNNIEKTKETWNERQKSDYWINRFPEKNLQVLLDKDSLQNLYETSTIPEIAEKLNVHEQTVYRHLNIHGLRTKYVSSYEQEIVNFLTINGIKNIVQNSRSILPSKKELDIYLPDYNIAIEYNGIYWHHDGIQHITKSYHHDKFIECEQNGIQLITIFSSHWNHKKEIVKNTLLNKLGVIREPEYARKCQVKKIKSRETRDFLNENHIQGYTPASICYGLFLDDVMLAAMTFSKSRIAIGKSSDDYELVRYASAKRVVGGAGKLLKQFQRDHPKETIYSYSNNEWSNGNLYKTLGFSLDTEVKPTYWYVNPKEEKMMHRFGFAKHRLVEKGHNKNLTERQITSQMGLLRVWDCGKRKWILK